MNCTVRSALIVLFFSLFSNLPVQAQQNSVSNLKCDSNYLEFLAENNLFSLVINLVEQTCPALVPQYVYAESLLRTGSIDKLILLIKSGLTQPQNSTESLNFNLIRQDIFFQLDDYDQYRNQLPKIELSKLPEDNLNRSIFLSELQDVGINYRYINTDILFSIRATDIDYLIRNKDILNNENIIIYPEVKSLYEKALIPDHKVASPTLAAIFSSIIPGSGRLLYNRFFDAFNSALLTLGSAYLTYKHWDDTPYNYLFGTISATFYISNIYGSYHGAVNANKANEIRIQFDAENIYYTFPAYLD